MPHHTDGSFEAWINEHKKVAIALLGSVGGVNLSLIFGSYFNRIQVVLNHPWFPGIWYSVHLLVVLILFGLTYVRSKRESVTKYPEPSKAVREFYRFLLVLWLVWAILYAALGYRAFDTMENRTELLHAAQDVNAALARVSDTEPIKPLLDNLVDINEARVMAKRHPRDNPDSSPESLQSALNNFHMAKESLRSRNWEFFLNWINNIQAAMVLLLFWVLAFPRKREQLIVIGLVVIVGTFLSMIIDRLFFERSMALLGGLFGGVAMALWVGRLDSKFLMAPPITTLMLYFYAILQATWFVFPDYDEGLLVITGLAMILKVIVYLVCSWLLSSGRLLYFCQEMRLLYGEKGAKPGPMLGRRTVDARLKAFLDDLDNEELLGCNE